MIEMSGNLFSKLLVLLGLAAISGMVYSYLQTSKVNNTITDINQLATNIHAMYGNAGGNYASLTNTVVLNGRDIAPADMIVGGVLTNQWGNAITIGKGSASSATVGTDSNFYINIGTVPQNACAKIINSIKSIQYANNAVTWRPMPVDPAQATADCAAGVGGQLLFLF